MRGMRGMAAVILCAVFTLPPAGPRSSAQEREPDSFRLFALGYKQLMANAESYDTWARSIATRIEQIETLLAAGRPNVVVLPESITLTAWLIGPRGQQAREDGNTAVSAIASLAGTYAPQVSYYEAKCNVPASRALVLALTDTVWRAFGETFSRLAKERGIYLVATADVAADITKVTDPAKVALLGDPEVATDYAYEAGCDKAYNAGYFFAPTGEIFAPDGSMPVGTAAAQIRGIVPKAYLVPIERDQTTGLALSSGSPSDVRPVDLGFASFGVFTSKDAWMSDLPNRNDVDGADVFLQPEAGAWAAWSEAGEKNWQQDAMHRAIWGFVQKLPAIRYGALSNLMGNFHDLPFDGTPTITSDAPDHRYEKRGRRDARHFLLGRRVDDGIVARSEWFAPDPPEGAEFSNIKERRRRLWEAGDLRAPGSGDEAENGYRADAFVWFDVPILEEPSPAARLERGPFGSSEVVYASDGAQWEPSLEMSGKDVFVAWTDLTEGDEDPLVARSSDRGWEQPVSVVPADSRPDDQQDNQYGVRIAAHDDTLHALWVDFRNQSWEVRASRAPLEALRFEEDVRVDHAKSSSEGFPNEVLDNDPAIAVGPDGTAVAAWSDLRARRVDRDVRFARLKKGASEWEGDDFVPGTSGTTAEQFHPSVALVGDRLEIAWQDHRNGDADVYVSGFFNPCGAPRPRGLECPAVIYDNARVDDGPKNGDAMTPALAGSPRGLPLVVWSDDRGGTFHIRAARMTRSGHPDDSIALAPSSGAQTYPAVTRVDKARWVVTWTDARAGDTDIALVPLTLEDGSLVAGDPYRVDDSNGADARLPDVATDGNDVWIAWEDRRDGPEQIRVTTVAVDRLFAAKGPRRAPSLS